MLGAIIGDIIGSSYEFNNVRDKEVPLFTSLSYPTDDSIMTLAVADVIQKGYAYDPEMLKSKDERESKAAKRIFGILPDDQKQMLYDLFYEFENCETPEAKFVNAMDNFQPLLLNDYNNGEDWKVHNIKKSQVVKRQITSKPGSEKIWQVTEKIIEKNAEKGNLIED